jgi:hypothetical protein
VKRSREEADDDELTLFSLSLFPLFSLFFCPSFPLSLCSSMPHHLFPLQLALSPSSSRPLFRRSLQRLLHPRFFLAFFEHQVRSGPLDPPSTDRSSSSSPACLCTNSHRMASAASSSTAVNAAPAPTTKHGYQGGGTALRRITSNQLVPTESLIAQAGREQELRERERGTVPDVEGGRQAKEGEKYVVAEGEGGSGEGYAEEWTFPDGGWKAWTVIFVRCSLSSSPPHSRRH